MANANRNSFAGHDGVTALAVSAADTLEVNEQLVAVTLPAVASTFAITLPSVYEARGRFYRFYVADATNPGFVTIQDNDETAKPLTITLSGANESVTLLSTGTEWIVAGNSFPIVTEKFVVDASGGSATVNLTTIPAGSLLMSIACECTATYDGDTTKNFSIGITGNTDKYIDPTDAANPTDGDLLEHMGGTNNDEKYFELLAAATQIVATIVNTASATAGSHDVYITYMRLY